MSRTRTQLANYRGVPFYAIKAVSLVSASIVIGILLSFSLQLKSDGFKIPWTFLIMALPAVLNMLVLLITVLFQCCGKPSPLLNMIMNFPLVLLWILGLTLLSWNMSGTLSHSCTIKNWGSDDGIKVCNTYKAMYSFILFAILSQIAQIVLDIRARREQSRVGKYNQMMETKDVKMEPTGAFGQPHGADQPFLQEQVRDEVPGWRPGASSNSTLAETAHSHPNESYVAYQPAKYAQFDTNHDTQQAHGHPQQSIRMNDFEFGTRPQYTAYNTGSSYHDETNRRY